MGKKKNKVRHVTYNAKVFLAPMSINSLSAIHCKINSEGIAKATISDCNHSIRIWNDLNTKEGKLEMIEKIDSLLLFLGNFKKELQDRL